MNTNMNEWIWRPPDLASTMIMIVIYRQKLFAVHWPTIGHTFILLFLLLGLVYRHVVFSIGSVCYRGWEVLGHESDPFGQYTSDDYAHNHSNEEDYCDHTSYAHQCVVYPTVFILGTIYKGEIMQTELAHFIKFNDTCIKLQKYMINTAFTVVCSATVST